MGDDEFVHGAQAKKQIRFANLRQRADGSMSLTKTA
jgi:hypothetical protein